MSIVGVSTFTDGRNVVALSVNTGRSTIKIDHSEKGGFVGVDDDETETLLEAEMLRRAPPADKSDISKVWIHINRRAGRRQGEFVIVTAPTRPTDWPEDFDENGEPLERE